MAQYRKKPVVIEAIKWPGFCAPKDAFLNWCDENRFDDFEVITDGSLIVPTLEGGYIARPGDWIIKGDGGEFYPCKPEIFAETYEPVK